MERSCPRLNSAVTDDGVNYFSNISTVQSGDEASLVSQLDNDNKKVTGMIETIHTSIDHDSTALSYYVSNLQGVPPKSRSALPLDIFPDTLSFAQDRSPEISTNISRRLYLRR